MSQDLIIQVKKKCPNMLQLCCQYIQCVPRKGFGSADCEALYTIYLFLCTQKADPNPFRGTHCMLMINNYVKDKVDFIKQL